MPATLTYSISLPLPPGLSADLLLAALCTLTPIITANPHLTSYSQRALAVTEVVDDPFFTHDDPTARLAAFDVEQRIPILPLDMASKSMTVPCVMQSFGSGVRCRSIASGVTVRSTWTVRTRGFGDKGEWGGGTYGVGRESPGEGGFELVEEATVECGKMVKPFVGRSFVSAHREILKRMVDALVEREQRRGNRWA